MTHPRLETEELSAQLIELAERLQAQAAERADDEDHQPQLVALLPCEPVVGPVAIACWEADEGERSYELLRFDGTPLHDAKALREAFVLLAMTEALEDQLEPLRLREIMDLLIDWQQEVRLDEKTIAAASPKIDAVQAAIWRVIEHLQRLEVDAGEPGEPRMARAPRLDQLGTGLRELESRWSTLEQCAGDWIDGSQGTDPAITGQLWTVLAAGRRGPLAEPTSALLEQGRQAGKALADEVLAG